MRHGAQGRQTQLHGKQRIAGAGKPPSRTRAQTRGQHPQHLFVPRLREPSAGAVVGNLQVAQISFLQLGDFGVQALTTFHIVGHGLGIAEIHLVDDGQHGNFKQDGVQPRAMNTDINLAVGQTYHVDVFFIQAKQAQKIHEVAFDETQGTHPIELLLGELQLAQRANFGAYFVHIGRQLHARGAAFEFVAHLRTRELVQHRLHHGEFVQIGIKQAGDDHGTYSSQVVKEATLSRGVRKVLTTSLSSA